MKRFEFISRNSTLTKVLLPVFFLLTLSSCLKDKDTDDFDSTAQAAIDEDLIKNYIQQNSLAAVRAESGLYYQITEAGRGDSIKLGDMATVHYRGMLLNGTAFDNSYERGSPITLQVGAGQYLAGFEEGIFRSRKGGKSTVLVPSHLGYRNQQAGDNIPPNSVLRFDLEVVHPDSVGAINERIIQAFLTKNNITNAVWSDSGFYYIPKTAGTGALPQTGDNVKVEYRAKFLNGVQFEPASSQEVATFPFRLGYTSLIKGFADGVRMLKVGETATFVFPSAVAYGAAGGPRNQFGSQLIPPHTVLQFEIKLVEITK